MEDSEKKKEELTEEVQIEAVKPESGPGGEVKRVTVTQSMSETGDLSKTTYAEVFRLRCGHSVGSATEVVVCVCSQTLCSKCSQENGVCNFCNRSLCRKCRKESLLDPKVFYCKKCRWFAWLRRLL